MSRVLVCGGRDYADVSHFNATLDAFHRGTPISLVIAGGAPGADTLAVEWADSRGVPFVIEPANWDADGRAAGPIRNQRMIDVHRPSIVIAFAGGRGTADMIRRAERAELRVVRL